MFKYYELEGHEVYCKVKNLKKAYYTFKENFGPIDFSSVKVISPETVVYCEELFTIGGYNESSIDLLFGKEEDMYIGGEEEIKNYVELERILNDF